MKNYIFEIFDKDTVLHLRIPFSLFLFPIFCFALSQAIVVHWTNTIIIFISLHFFIYPGSNAYNSYMDKDEGSIGGLKTPPPVTVKLFYASIIMDILGLVLCLLVGAWLLLFMLMYVAISRAYSWRGIRLKKYPILGWLVVVVSRVGLSAEMRSAPGLAPAVELTAPQPATRRSSNGAVSERNFRPRIARTPG